MWEGLVAAALVLRRWGGRTRSWFEYEQLDRIEIAGRRRFRPWAWSAVAATSLLGLAALLARPSLYTVALGRHYAALATNPFGAESNPVGFRLATPVLSYFLGLRGEALIVTNLLLAWLLLFVVHLYFVRRSGRPGDALAAASAVAVSLVTLAPLYFGGYCDTLTYLAIFGAWAGRRRPWAVALCTLVGLVNHEAYLFVLPWLLWESWRALDGRLARTVLVTGVVAALAAYLGYRAAVSGLRPVEFSLAYYVDPLVADPLHWARKSSPYWLLGLFSVYRLLWWVPALYAADSWRRKDRMELASLGLLFAGAASSLLVAFDTSRLWSLAFPALLVGMARTPPEETSGWRSAFVGVFLANFLVPPLFTAEGQIVLLHSPLAYAVLSALGLPK